MKFNYYTGGYYYDDGTETWIKEILRYDPTSNQWIAAGEMKSPRSEFAVVPLANITHLCSPIDGSWGTWSDWSSCSTACVGSQRTRQCDDPPPLNGGSECPGYSQEGRSCNRKNCPVELIGGNGYSSGNVFVVNHNGYFGPVCHDGWTNTSATIVCR